MASGARKPSDLPRCWLPLTCSLDLDSAMVTIAAAPAARTMPSSSPSPASSSEAPKADEGSSPTDPTKEDAQEDVKQPAAEYSGAAAVGARVRALQSQIHQLAKQVGSARLFDIVT